MVLPMLSLPILHRQMLCSIRCQCVTFIAWFLRSTILLYDFSILVPRLGASHHVTADIQSFQHLTPFEGPDLLYRFTVRIFRILTVISSSSISSSNPHTSLTLRNLLYVPSITTNLVSVSQFARDNRVFFEFHLYVCLVKSQETNQVLLQGCLDSDGLYKFSDFKFTHLCSSPAVIAASTLGSTSSSFSSNNAANVWHLRYVILNQCS